MIKRIGFLILVAWLTPTWACDVMVEKPYVRASIPGVPNTAAFLKLTNDCAEPIALVKADSKVAKRIELHNHVHENGMMKMREVKSIVVPANGSVALKPGSFHIMFFDVNERLKPTESVTILLSFDNGKEMTIQAPVKDLMSSPHH